MDFFFFLLIWFVFDFLKDHLCDLKEPKDLSLVSLEFTLTKFWLYIHI